MTTPLLHIIGAGPWQLATIRRARALGCRVLVTDGGSGRPGFAEADLHAVADITDPEATLAAARRHRIDGVLCDTTDNGVLAAAYVADTLGLPGPGLTAARNCTDKARLTACAAQAGLPVPRSHPAANAAEALQAVHDVLGTGGAAIVKPVDNQSGRGVGVVRTAALAAAAIAHALRYSASGRLLVQPFVEGVELIIDSLVVGRQVHRLGIGVKTPYADNPTISSAITYGEPASPLPLATLDAINKRLLQALQVQQGLVHAEYIVGGQHALPIDVAVRGGGVLIYPLVLPHVSGVDAMACAIDLALGRPVTVQPRQPPRGAHIQFLRADSGRILRIDGADIALAMPGIAALRLNQQPGDMQAALTDKDQRLGYVIALADTAAQARAQALRAAQVVQVKVQPPS
ncbi:MAG: hypothetical protein LH480_14535 [Rubrivivax sp.]|nr:hypothetical protein [Rubrivivax sp.]